MTSTATPSRTAGGSTLQDVGAWVTEHLPALLAEHDVPAAAVAVGLGDDVVEAAAGVLHLGTGVEADTDSVFQIGSVTKVWTATLVLQLVDEGLLDLDATVRTYLPDFRVADESASATMTVRQLLCHTAGFEGDVFTDTGRGDDCVEKLVATLDDVPQLFPPGELFSYNNAGYCVLGRIVEVAARGVLRRLPRRAPHRPARPDPRRAQPLRGDHVPRRHGARAARPEGRAGARTLLGADPLQRPGRRDARDDRPRPRRLRPDAPLRRRGGRRHPGAHAGVGRGMRTHEVSLPDLRVLGTGWGLGWELFENVGVPMVGHDGNTVGQASFLRVVPELGLSVALLTNGGDPYGLFHDVVGHVLRELAGIELAGHPKPPADPEPLGDVSRYLGTFGNRVMQVVVSQDDEGRVWSEISPKGASPDPDSQGQRSELVRLAPDVLIPLEPISGLHIPHAFVGSDGEGRAAWVHLGRAVPREG